MKAAPTTGLKPSGFTTERNQLGLHGRAPDRTSEVRLSRALGQLPVGASRVAWYPGLILSCLTGEASAGLWTTLTIPRLSALDAHSHALVRS